MQSSSSADAARFDITKYLEHYVVNPRHVCKGTRVLRLDGGFNTRRRINNESICQAMGHEEIDVEGTLTESLLTEAFPRGVAWTDFPVVSAPFYRLDRRHGRYNIMSLPTELESYDDFVVEAQDNRDDTIRHHYLAGYVLSRGLPAEHRQNIWIVDDANVLMRTKPADLMVAASVHRMFDYSYVFNFKAIGMKALVAAMSVPVPAREDAGYIHEKASRYPILKDVNLLLEINNTSLSDTGKAIQAGIRRPMFLQLLYALRRAGTSDASYFLRDGISPWLTTPSMSEVTSDGRYWRGTGKYPAARIDPLDRIRVEAALFMLGLVDIDRDKAQTHLTARGEAFLDMLHPDCNDPDVMCRWRPEGSSIIMPEHGNAVREWLTRYFRKMKTRVNLLP